MMQLVEFRVNPQPKKDRFFIPSSLLISFAVFAVQAGVSFIVAIVSLFFSWKMAAIAAAFTLGCTLILVGHVLQVRKYIEKD
jgi:hypothetical protein